MTYKINYKYGMYNLYLMKLNSMDVQQNKKIKLKSKHFNFS